MAWEGRQWRAAVSTGVLVGGSLAVLAEAMLGGGLVDTPMPLLVMCVCGYAVGAWASPPVAVASVLVAGSALGAANQVFAPSEYPLVDDLFFFVMVAGAPAIAGAAVAGRARQVRQLRQLGGQLAIQRDTEVQAVRLRERNRIEVYLHRGFSEQFSAIVMRAESVVVGAGGADVRTALADIEQTARATLDELRRALGTLRDRAEQNADPPAAREVALGRHVSPSQSGPGLMDLTLALVLGLAIGVEGSLTQDAQGPPLLNLGLGLVTGLALTWRRSRPVLAATVCFAAISMMSAWGTPLTVMVTPIAPLLLCAYGAGAYLHRWSHRLAALGITFAGGCVAILAAGASVWEDDGSWPSLAWAALAFGAGVVTEGWSARAAQEHWATAELAQSREIAVQLAVAEQRAALARDLHDSVAHAMTVICLQASARQATGGRCGSGPSDAEDDVFGAILASARQGLAQLRDGLDALEGDDPLDAEVVVGLARRVGLTPQVELGAGLDRLPEAVRALAARLFREAVVNAGRYAPGSRIVLTAAVSDGQVRMEAINDRIAGGPADFGSGAGTGLGGLATAVRRRGGTFDAGATTAGGWRVRAVLPVEPPMLVEP